MTTEIENSEVEVALIMTEESNKDRTISLDLVLELLNKHISLMDSLIANLESLTGVKPLDSVHTVKRFSSTQSCAVNTAILSLMGIITIGVVLINIYGVETGAYDQFTPVCNKTINNETVIAPCGWRSFTNPNQFQMIYLFSILGIIALLGALGALCVLLAGYFDYEKFDIFPLNEHGMDQQTEMQLEELFNDLLSFIEMHADYFPSINITNLAGLKTYQKVAKLEDIKNELEECRDQLNAYKTHPDTLQNFLDEKKYGRFFQASRVMSNQAQATEYSPLLK